MKPGRVEKGTYLERVREGGRGERDRDRETEVETSVLQSKPVFPVPPCPPHPAPSADRMIFLQRERLVI